MAISFLGARQTTRHPMPVASATVIEAGDLLYLASGAVLPASSQADNGAEPDNQAEFARNFVGIALESSADGDTDDVLVETGLDMEYLITVPSGTYTLGEFLGASEASSGTALEDQQLESVGSAQDLAIAVCTKEEASAVTSLRVRFIRSAVSAPALQERVAVNTETLAGTRTLTHDDVSHQALDPDGAVRNVDLPAEEESSGLVYVIKNTGVATEVITIRNDAAATVGSIDGTEQAYCWCDGTTWHCAFGVATT